MGGMEQETIVAISTPVGRGGIGVVRLRGRARGRSLRRWCGCAIRLPRDTRDSASWWMCPASRDKQTLDDKRRYSVSGETVLDEVVVTFFAAPNSYTGEDVVEIAAHGSPVLLEYVVRQCCAGGARLAEPGEFTQRAFLAGRIDLTQAEAVNDLIGSSRWSRRAWRRGRWAGRWRGWSRR